MLTSGGNRLVHLKSCREGASPCSVTCSADSQATMQLATINKNVYAQCVECYTIYGHWQDILQGVCRVRARCAWKVRAHSQYASIVVISYPAEMSETTDF